MRSRLPRRDESRAHARRGRTRVEHAPHAVRRRDPTRRDDGDLPRHRPQHSLQEGKKRRRTAQAAAGLDALHHNHVAARSHGPARLGFGADLPAREPVRAVHARHERRIGIPVEELDEPRSVRRDLDALRIDQRDEEVDPERAAGEPADLVDHLAQGGRRHHDACEHPVAACVRDRGDQLRGAHRPHRRELQRQLTADKLCETGSRHRSLNGASRGGSSRPRRGPARGSTCGRAGGRRRVASSAGVCR